MTTGLIIGAPILLFAYGYWSDRERKSSKEDFKIDLPATKEELKALKFYRQTKCFWGVTTRTLSDKGYIESLRGIEHSISDDEVDDML